MNIRIRDRYTQNQLITALSKFFLFRNLSPDLMNTITNTGELIQVNHSEYLIQQDESDTALYILIYGRLRVIREQAGNAEFLGEYTAGDVVGELAFFSKLPRYANVIAIRNSVLLKISPDQFINHMDYYQFLMNLSCYSITRLQNSSIRNLYKANYNNIMIYQIGHASHCHDLIQEIYQTLNQKRKTHLISSHEIKKLYQKEIHWDDPSFNAFILSYLTDCENEYDTLLYLPDKEMTGWTEFCLGQADRVLGIAKSDDDQTFNEIDRYFTANLRHSNPIVDIAIFYPTHQTFPDRTHIWLKDRYVDGFHNIRESNVDDHHRLIRTLMGENVNLILSGGGAKGLASIGVMKAMKEFNIPIDFVGGASIGSALAGVYARFGDIDVACDVTIDHFERMKTGHLTYPEVSLYSGQYNAVILKHMLGEDLLIENLWRRFFAVATDLTDAKLVTFERGSLWEACRAGSTLPIIYPPAISHSGHIIVDGVVLNNLPLDVMCQIAKGGKFIASRLKPTASPKLYEPTFVPYSGWRLLFEKLIFKKKRLPSLSTMYNKMLLLGSHHHQESMVKETDCTINIDIHGIDLLEFNQVRKIVGLGYEIGMRELEDFAKKHKW